jgi:hypothetical protein
VVSMTIDEVSLYDYYQWFKSRRKLAVFHW